MPQPKPTLSDAGKKALEGRLSNLVDDRYRYVHIGKYQTTHPIIKSRDSEIQQLRQDLEAFT